MVRHADDVTAHVHTEGEVHVQAAAGVVSLRYPHHAQRPDGANPHTFLGDGAADPATGGRHALPGDGRLHRVRHHIELQSKVLNKNTIILVG